MACGPGPSESEPPLGTLEWEGPGIRVYRHGGRVEFVPGPDNPFVEHGCVYLTDTAVGALEDAIASVDPSEMYLRGEHACGFTDDFGTSVIHVAGAEYSPFVCTMTCCHDTIFPILTTYFLAAQNRIGEFLDDEDTLVVNLGRECILGE